MDLGTIEELVASPQPAHWRPGDAWLAGGTWLFSEPQPHLRRLLDLTSLGWPPLTVRPDGLLISATCTVAQLYAFEPPPEWAAGPLIRQCCQAFLASFKIWNAATVGGNLANALPAGPMISLTAALGGQCAIWAPDGSTRSLSVLDLVVGNNRHTLAPGELIRSISLPVEALRGRTAFRQESLNTLGRSAALLIGRLDAGGFTLTVTASTVRPVRLHFPAVPQEPTLRAAIETAIPPDLYHDDVHGLPAWRRHLTFRLAEEIRQDLKSSRDHARLRTPGRVTSHDHGGVWEEGE